MYSKVYKIHYTFSVHNSTSKYNFALLENEKKIVKPPFFGLYVQIVFEIIP